MYDISPLFYRQLQSNRFSDNISINDEQDQMLLSSRSEVRRAIRAAFTNAQLYLQNKSDITAEDIQWITTIKPKFMTQGSYAYKTLNAPCYTTQDIDLDDGVYLPMSILNGEPNANREWFFQIVDGALATLAREKGWKVGEKDTCARVILPSQAHIDVPLYAVPDKRFVEMSTGFENLRKEHRRLSNAIYDADTVDSQPYLLNADEVYLATRESGWKKSDPLLIANWFKQEISTKGRRLRRVCRFLKAWRDFTWEHGGPSSITLMICAAEAYPQDDQSRDDLALLNVVRALPGRLRGQVINPAASDEEVIYPRGNLPTEEFAVQAENLLHALETSISGAMAKEQVPAKMIARFGKRMPADSRLIDVISSAAIVRSTPAKDVKPEPIPNSKSG